MPGHQPHPHPDHHNHGTRFANWGWSNSYPETVIVERQESDTPTWVWILGGALAGMVLAAMGRR